MSEFNQAEADDGGVAVCICTFQRPSLYDTLASLSRQRGAPAFKVIVADNDEQPSAAPIVARAKAGLALDVQYLHAPARNISIARNACLDAATSDLIAFIDDDELAPSFWLSKLAAGLAEQEVDIVFGPVHAIYPADAPGWAFAGDFHSFRPAFRANGLIDTGYSSNVLFRRAIVGDLRFDPALGRSGGEDTQFFAALYARGAKLGFAPGANVNEPALPARLTTRWLLARAFRSGQSHARVLRDRAQTRLRILGPASAKAVYCAGAALMTAWSPVRFRQHLIRAALHLGVVAKALGAREPVLYGLSPRP